MPKTSSFDAIIIGAGAAGMFCAALHKGLSKAEKEKYRAKRLGGEPKNKKMKRA